MYRCTSALDHVSLRLFIRDGLACYRADLFFLLLYLTAAQILAQRKFRNKLHRGELSQSFEVTKIRYTEVIFN